MPAARAFARRPRAASAPASSRARVPALVPACTCAGQCRCGSLVPALLMRQLEFECEHYREVF